MLFVHLVFESSEGSDFIVAAYDDLDRAEQTRTRLDQSKINQYGPEAAHWFGIASYPVNPDDATVDRIIVRRDEKR